MKKSRKELETYLHSVFKRINDVQKLRDIYSDINGKYNIPIINLSDFASMRTSGEELSEFILFTILEKINSSLLDSYYTETEINTYKETKYEIKKISFPLYVDNIIKVSDDQFIGVSSVKFLMQLRENQLINYNENSQRTMKRLIKGNTEVYQINLNKKAVSEIKDLFNNGHYIPNVITLNIPEDADFYYDEDNKRLVIKSMEFFDILDGYHRYIAMSQLFDEDNNFDYPIEIRISNFILSKAKQFIYQEDKKTQMHKNDSASFNQYNYGNMMTERLNNDALCDISGMIGRNGSQISFSDFSKIVNYLWFRNISQKDGKKLVRDVEIHIRNIFNILAEYDEGLLYDKYSVNKIAILLYTCYRSDEFNAIDNYEKLKHSLDDIKSIMTYSGSIRKIMMIRFTEALNGGDYNV